MNETFELIKKEIEREGIENVIFIHKLKKRNGKFPYSTTKKDCYYAILFSFLILDNP